MTIGELVTETASTVPTSKGREARVTLDIDSLSRLHRYEDPDLGFSESFADVRLGPAESLAIVTLPRSDGDGAGLGFVVCPSLGVEQGHLRRLEALVSRTLTQHGFPVVRIRPNPPVGDGPCGAIDMTTRLREVEEAADLLRRVADVGELGLVGAMFGATVSALACERLGSSSLVLVEPVVRGRRYMRETLRRHAIAGLVTELEDGGGSGAHRPQGELETRGWTSIRGLRLSRADFETISAVNLVEDVRSFRGRSLLVGVSPSGAAAPGLVGLADHLRALGGDTTVEVIEDPLPVPFGEFSLAVEGPSRVDTRLNLDRRLAGLIASWAEHARRPAPTAEAV